MLEIKTSKKGAELISVKLEGKEFLHDGLTFWNRHSPVLFPIVGQIKEGKTIIDGKEYFMGQHGFARDMEFEEIGKNAYVLKYNEETLKKFPFKFKLYIRYEVKENNLKIKYEVENIDDKKIYFGFGTHPAFQCNYSKNNVYIEFSENEKNVEFYQLKNGLLNKETIPSTKFIQENIIKINKDTFVNDAIIIKNLKSDEVTLFENGKGKIKVNYKGFKYLAIWSKPEAPFVCIEPWYNTADSVDSDGIFANKEDLIELEENQKFKAELNIEIIE